VVSVILIALHVTVLFFMLHYKTIWSNTWGFFWDGESATVHWGTTLRSKECQPHDPTSSHIVNVTFSTEGKTNGGTIMSRKNWTNSVWMTPAQSWLQQEVRDALLALWWHTIVWWI